LLYTSHLLLQDLYVYSSKNPQFSFGDDKNSLLMMEKDVKFGDYKDERSKTIQIPVDDVLVFTLIQVSPQQWNFIRSCIPCKVKSHPFSSYI
jgi:hypothetical protein